jgi:uncharacterized membrane protein
MLMRWVKDVLVTLALAAVLHWLIIAAVPYAVLLRLRTRGRSRPNIPVHAERIDDSERLVPLPNPDFVYSVMGYDLRHGPVRLRGRIPRDTYFSISAYASNTVNFFVVSDRELRGDAFDVVLVPQGSSKAEMPISGGLVVEAPTTLGVVIVRYLLLRNEDYPNLREIQHAFHAERVSG